MYARILALFAFVAVGTSAALAPAQYFPPQHPGAYPAQYPAAYNGYGYYHHASTLEEGLANGLANLMHAAGAANLLHSQAARNYQEAHARYLDNRLKATDTLFEMRKLNRERVAAERGPRPTAEEMAAYARERAPKRPSPGELDLLTGRVAWPAILEDEAYRPHRERIEELMLKWVRSRGLAPEEHLELQTAARALENELKRRVRDYAPADYVKAKSLLAGLVYEVAEREAAFAKEEGKSGCERFVAADR